MVREERGGGGALVRAVDDDEERIQTAEQRRRVGAAARPLLPLPHRPRALRTLDGLALRAVVVGGSVLLIAKRERLLHL